MKMIAMDMSDAMQQAVGMPFAYIAGFCSLSLGPTPESIDWDEILDARFFSDGAELRVVREDGLLTANLIERADADAFVEHTVPIVPKFGRSITKRAYLTYDADGQAQVAAVCLCGWEG